MRTYSLLFIVLLMMVINNSYAGSFDWARMQPHGWRGDYPLDCKFDSFGNILAVGNATDCQTCSFGYLSKYDSLGNLIFNLKTNYNAASITSVGTDFAGNIYITSYRASQIGSTIFNSTNASAIIKLNGSGILLWSQDWGNQQLKLTVDSAGNIFVTNGDTLRRYNQNGILSWSIPLEIKYVDVDGSKLIVASDTVIHLISKANGAILNSTPVPDCKALSVTKTGEVYFTGSGGTGKLLNMIQSWILPGLIGKTIDANQSGAYVAEVIFESQTLKDTSRATFVDKNGIITMQDTIYSSIIVKLSVNTESKVVMMGQFDYYTIDEITATAFFKPFFVFRDYIQPNGSGFFMGVYNPLPLPKLAFSKLFWDINNSFAGFWQPGARCIDGTDFYAHYKLYDYNFSPGNIIFVEMSDINGNFTNPTILGALSTTNSEGVVSCQIPTGLTTPGTYSIRIRSTSLALMGVQNSCPLDMNVSSLSIVLSGNSNTICSKSEMLSVAPSNYYNTHSKQWQRNNININGANSSFFTPTQSGTYKCIVTDNNGCSRASLNQITVNVLPSPSASLNPTGSQEICKNDSVVLSVPANLNNTFQWYKGNALLNGQTANSYSAKTAGNYKAIVTGANGCTKTSSTYKLSVYKSTASAFGPTAFCAGGSVVLGASNNGSTNWQWKLNNVNIPGAVAQFYAATQAGTYKALTTNANGCTSVTNAINVVVNCREGDGTDPNSDLINYQLYPNPANEEVKIIWKNISEQTTQISCINVLGQLALPRQSSRGIGQQQFKINTSALEPGVYYVQLRSEDGSTETRKLVVER